MLLSQKLVFDSKALHPIKIYSFPPILRYSIHLSEISVGSYSHIDIVVSQPLTAACDLGLQAVVS